MINFCPDGYLLTREAIACAAEYWFPEKVAALESAAPPESAANPDNSIEAAVRAFSRPPIPEERRRAFDELATEAVHRLRNFLHQGKLNAYYFDGGGRRALSRDFWVISEADGVLETSTYWPFGQPNAWHERRPSCPLFLLRSELDTLLSDQPSRRPFPQAKLPDLVAALRRLDDLPNRKKQRAAIGKLPEFGQYHISDDVFRKAEKQAPRKSGRKVSPS
jgi:hypothetical protein